MATDPQQDLFFDLPASGIHFATTPLLDVAYAYGKEHTSTATVNHTLRSAAYALIITQKLPHLATADKELIVVASILHDLGWATTKSLLSKDKRFEVDGANLARDFITKHTPAWDHRRLQLVWDGIALHTTPSIAQYKEPEVAAISMGILADFMGSKFPGGLISVAEHKEVVRAYPRMNFAEEMVGIMCGLCREKPETTMDNFVSEFGLMYGLDGKGAGVEEFAKKKEEYSVARMLMGSLDACEVVER